MDDGGEFIEDWHKAEVREKMRSWDAGMGNWAEAAPLNDGTHEKCWGKNARKSGLRLAFFFCMFIVPQMV